MKNFVKFIPVALGLLTLASCSNDELLGEKGFDASQLKEGEMLVEFEEASEYGDAFTRSYTDRTMKKHRWTETEDQLKVYGQDFGAYDLYAFSWKTDQGATTGVFKRQHMTSNIGTPKWALFPLKNVKRGTWTMGDNHNSVTDVTMTLPEFVTYGAAYDAPNYQTGADLDPYYLDELPRFGEVGEVENGEALHTNMKYMTAVLRLQLAGIPTYATGVKIQMREAGDPAKTLVINGDFTTRIATNNRIEVNGIEATMCDGYNGSPYAVNPDEDGAVYVYIPASTALTPKDNKKGVLYIPLPTWTKETAIAISTSTDYEGEDGTVDHAAATWNDYKVLSKKVIERAKVYGNKKEYNLALDGTDPGAISDALDLIETDEETITIVANDEITVCETGSATTIEIPNNNPSVKNVIIDLSNGLAGCAADQTLKIVYQNDSNPFTGNVTLIAAPAATAVPVKLDVNLPKSGFAIVAGQPALSDLSATISQAAAGDIDIDAEEFVVGNDNKYTPTQLDVTALKFSPNVKTFTVAKEGQLNGDFAIDQQTNPKPEDWTFGAVATINISGVVAGSIDATTDTYPTFPVAVNVTGEQIENSIFGYEAPTVTGDILTRGTVTINAGKYVIATPSENKLASVGGAITAEGAITATGYATLGGAIESTKATVALAGHTNAANVVKADGNIDITQQAMVASDITSTKGNITIDNDYTELAWLGIYAGDITATAGSVSLNQAVEKETGNYLVAQYNGDITAGTDFTMTGLTYTDGAILLSGTATINVAPQEGNCVAVAGSLAYQLGTDYQLKLLQGYVTGLDATAGKVKLFFATTPAYAALAGVTEENNVLPQNVSVWNGDYEIASYPGFAGNFDIDADRIWTATQLGYMITAAQTDVELRSDINLNNQEWPGITTGGATTFTGLLDETKADDYYQFKTISNLNLTNPSSQKTAGFFADASAGSLTVSNIKFNGVKTSLDMVSTALSGLNNKSGDPLPKVNMFGVGAVVGMCDAITMSRVSATLAGGKFGSNGEDNLKSASIGGLIGFASGAAELSGVTVDATAAALSGWFSLGGIIGHAEGDIVIGLADASAKQKAVKSDVTGFAINVTHYETATKNDLYQGMTGSFIGSSYAGVTISDVKNALINADFHTTTDGAREDLAFKITNIGTTNRHYFGRTAQTLVGHDGMYDDPAIDYTINEVTYQVYMEFSPAGHYVPGTKHFYDLTIEPHMQ